MVSNCMRTKIEDLRRGDRRRNNIGEPIEVHGIHAAFCGVALDHVGYSEARGRESMDVLEALHQGAVGSHWWHLGLHRLHSLAFGAQS